MFPRCNFSGHELVGEKFALCSVTFEQVSNTLTNLTLFNCRSVDKDVSSDWISWYEENSGDSEGLAPDV